MLWKFTNDRPVYQQIIDQLQSAVVSGRIEPGERIPSVRDLAMDMGVNPNTVQRAFRDLESTGLLVTEGTNGRFVTSDETILGKIKTDCITQLAQECTQRFLDLGITPIEASQILLQLAKERNDV